MSKPQKKCVFCGGTPATKSHIWPDWIGSLPLHKPNHHMVHVGKLETFETSAEGPASQTIIRQGRAGARKPRNTCVTCNGGWMSKIEQAAKPTLSALILGEPVLLGPADQALLSSLLCLIAIRVEFTEPQMQAVPAEDRRILMTTGNVPPHTWKIWIARYHDDVNPEDHWTGHLGMQVVSDPTHTFRPHKCNTQVTTMVMGKFLAHLVSSTVMALPGGYSDVQLTRIWPTSGLDKIDSREMGTLNRFDATDLHESLARSLKAVGE
jgi:hypothetical protein